MPAVQTTAQDFAQVLKRKRVSYTGEEVSPPQPLTLLAIIPGLPSIATGEVRKALADPSVVLLPVSERVGVRPARVHACPVEWNKIGLELLRRGVVCEAAREDAPVVDGQPVLVGAFGVEKRGTPLPPATRVLRLIVNAIPINKHIEQMPVGGEWLHIALETGEIVLWSSDDIQGCFPRVFTSACLAAVDDFVETDSCGHVRQPKRAVVRGYFVSFSCHICNHEPCWLS